MNLLHKKIITLNAIFFDTPRLLHAFNKAITPEENILAGVARHIQTMGCKAASKKEYLKRASEFNLTKSLAALAQRNINLLYFDSPDYPALLKQISDPPLVLFYQGQLKLLQTPLLAIVGTRTPSNYGKEMSRYFSHALSSAFTIVSGLAYGVDTCAHAAALKKGATTIGIQGTGPEMVYPLANKPIYDHMKKTGLLLTEFPIGTPGKPRHFPQRNRLISGLSKAVVVIEAKEKSGALLTARFAADQNRDVFALPGRIDSPLSNGPHQLIQEGAILAQSPEAILEALKEPIPSLFSSLSTPPKPALTDTQPINLPPSELMVLDILSATEPLHIDTLLSRLEKPANVILSSLSLLELKGHIKQMPGKHFIRAAH